MLPRKALWQLSHASTPFYVDCFSNRVLCFLCVASLGPWSSYLWLPCSWDCRHESVGPVCCWNGVFITLPSWTGLKLQSSHLQQPSSLDYSHEPSHPAPDVRFLTTTVWQQKDPLRWGQGGEMTQTTYAHVNKWIIKKIKKDPLRKWHQCPVLNWVYTFRTERGLLPWVKGQLSRI
jgi:hypothetical protein